MTSSVASGSSRGRGRAHLQAAPDFAVTARSHDPETIVILLEGDTDLHVASRLEDALEEAASASATRIVLDLTEVTLFDSSAIHALLAGRSHAASREKHLALVSQNPSILQVLEIAGIPELVPVYSSFTQATDDLPPAA